MSLCNRGGGGPKKFGNPWSRVTGENHNTRGASFCRTSSHSSMLCLCLICNITCSLLVISFVRQKRAHCEVVSWCEFPLPRFQTEGRCRILVFIFCGANFLHQKLFILRDICLLEANIYGHNVDNRCQLTKFICLYNLSYDSRPLTRQICSFSLLFVYLESTKGRMRINMFMNAQCLHVLKCLINVFLHTFHPPRKGIFWQDNLCNLI
jgi:hypothetical protein